MVVVVVVEGRLQRKKRERKKLCDGSYVADDD